MEREYSILANTRVMGVTDPKGHTSNLWAKRPLYGSNATGRQTSQEIHYQPLFKSDGRTKGNAISPFCNFVATGDKNIWNPVSLCNFSPQLAV